jgi:hypothetical protein
LTEDSKISLPEDRGLGIPPDSPVRPVEPFSGPRSALGGAPAVRASDRLLPLCLVDLGVCGYPVGPMSARAQSLTVRSKSVHDQKRGDSKII